MVTMFFCSVSSTDTRKVPPHQFEDRAGLSPFLEYVLQWGIYVKPSDLKIDDR